MPKVMLCQLLFCALRPTADHDLAWFACNVGNVRNCLFISPWLWPPIDTRSPAVHRPLGISRTIQTCTHWNYRTIACWHGLMHTQRRSSFIDAHYLKIIWLKCYVMSDFKNIS
jgi:hypothetical protein